MHQNLTRLLTRQMHQPSPNITTLPTHLIICDATLQSHKYSFLCWITHTHTHTHTRLTAHFPGQPGWAGTRKVKPIWVLLKQETVSSSGISWAVCKSPSRSRQITKPALLHSVFTGRMSFRSPNQQCQSIDGTILCWITWCIILSHNIIPFYCFIFCIYHYPISSSIQNYTGTNS